VWIHKDLEREKKIRREDCFLVSKSQRFDLTHKVLSFSRDIWGGSDAQATFAKVVRKISMAEGGRWVWHRAPRPGSRGGYQAQRGRGRGLPN
jgi:hypothetical protein